mgnify:CR=1 FL=1
MKHQSNILALKYRPSNFQDLIGQEYLVETIQKSIDQNKIPNAYIFTGIRGVGKTTTARIVAKMLNCTVFDKNNKPDLTNCEQAKAITEDRHPDVIEIDAASNTSVENAREIIERLGDGSLDIGFSGFDLLKESEINTQKKINVVKRYDFGRATLVVAIPDPWIDVQTVADLEEIAFEFKDKKKKRLRVATKYPNLTREFLFSKGVTQFKLIDSLGATEAYPFTGSSEIITDITSTGETLKANNLRILKDGEILRSEACMMVSKSSSNKMGLRKMLKLISKY